MRVGPHPHALRLDSLRSLAAAAGAHPAGANPLLDFVWAEASPLSQLHQWREYTEPPARELISTVDKPQ